MHPQLSGGRSPSRTQNLDPEGPGPHILLESWSLPMSGVDKIRVVVFVTNSYLVWLDTPTLTPGVQGAQKGGLVGFWGLIGAFW